MIADRSSAVFKPSPHATWIEVVGFVFLTFLGRCILVGLAAYIGCYASLVIMWIFSKHPDAYSG